VSDSGNDFSSEPWRENPSKVLSMAARIDPEVSLGLDEGTGNMRQSRRIRRLARRCIRRRIDRELVGSAFSEGLDLLRQALMVIAGTWVEKGWLGEKEDIFYLEWDEVAAVREGRNVDGSPVSETVARQRADMAAAATIRLPEMILGDRPPQGRVSELDSNVLRGIPASNGTYAGTARILRSTSDEAKLRSGDVLIVPYSDMGWVPLFSRAGAIVAEAGGTLSHAAIIARELHIPAVVSVDEACALEDGTVVVVDGNAGTVTLKAGGAGERSLETVL
ncbi:PEP-utilizing enzyme, partial [Candidatus Bipolaricaulota bacterium]